MNRFLRYIRAERYGGLTDFEIGPFTSGLNVVYGPNEAGKSTAMSLVDDVLFGWEDGHGVRNTYRPAGGDRAGELEWAKRDTAAQVSDGALRDIVRRDEDGITGDVSVLDDIDKATFDAVFFLTSDELRSLKNSSDVTARLLTAGSGTASSPATAFVEIERRIANSPVYRLETELEKKQEQLKAAAEQVRYYIQEDRELRELEVSRASAMAHVSALDDELESLAEWRSELEVSGARLKQLTSDRDELTRELEEFSGNSGDGGTGDALDDRLLALDASAELALLSRLDELDEEQVKLSHAVDIAKENSSTSTAAYEALCELDGEGAIEGRDLRSRAYPAIVSVLLPVAFILAGLPLFAHGREINSLSFTALGIGLLVVAVFLAFAAFFVLFRRPKEGEGLDERRKDAQWVMLQDRKKLTSCLADQEAFEQRVVEFLDGAGLGAAEGSLRQARTLLDSARDVRMARAEEAQRASSLELRIRAIDEELDEIATSRARVAAQLGSAVPNEDALHVLMRRIREKTAQRDALIEAGDNMSQRYGELTRELEHARADRTVDQVKFEYQQLRTRLRDAKHELIVLMLAKRMLERSIAMWESQSQPEVNALAGRLLALITNGRWVKVATSTTGSLVAVDADGVERDPRHLSLGTCQQLYLSLRVALLISGDDVGRAVPVLADDILVNFDAERRRGAARVLAELAEYRQVIMFTCHEETVIALREAMPSSTRIDLT